MSGSYKLYELYEKFTNSWEEASWLSFPPIWESDLILETVIITRKLKFTWYLERASFLYRVDGQKRD